MVTICALGSGSNGNAYYIGVKNAGILVDCGISCRMLITRAEKCGIDLAHLKGVFISHEHCDHIRGLPRFHSIFPSVPIYFNEKALAQVKEEDAQCYADSVEDLEETEIKIGPFEVVPFLKEHDAAFPLSFVVKVEGKTIGVFTDIGKIDQTFQSFFSQCHAAFLETNYHHDMLEYGPYPYYLKTRVKATHLSNVEAFSLVKGSANPALKVLIFSHISKDNNSYEKIIDQFNSFDRYQLSLAKREECGEIFIV